MTLLGWHIQMIHEGERHLTALFVSIAIHTRAEAQLLVVPFS